MQYFVHIPRSAGTSLLAFLLGHPDCTSRIFTIYRPFASQDARRERANVHPDTLFFGHFGVGFHTLWNDSKPRYVTVLRDPVERVVSFYRYCAGSPHHPLHQLIARDGMTLNDFVTARVSGEMNDLAVRFITASYHPLPILFDQTCNRLARLRGRGVRRCPGRRLGIARGILNRFDHVGSMRKIDETASFLLTSLGCRDFPHAVGRENTSDEGTAQLDASTRRLIETENELDLELYRQFS
jgi:hypothetical protein